MVGKKIQKRVSFLLYFMTSEDMKQTLKTFHIPNKYTHLITKKMDMALVSQLHTVARAFSNRKYIYSKAAHIKYSAIIYLVSWNNHIPFRKCVFLFAKAVLILISLSDSFFDSWVFTIVKAFPSFLFGTFLSKRPKQNLIPIVFVWVCVYLIYRSVN